jgi:hypothetical protein
MIGRIGNPRIFPSTASRCPPGWYAPPCQPQSMLSFYGQEKGLILFRKHLSRYLSPLGLPPEERKRLLTLQHPEEFLQILDSYQL